VRRARTTGRIGLLLGLLAAAGAAASGPERAAPRHLLFVVVDTLRRDHVGLYGHGVPTTPFVDELAEDGLVYLAATTQASHTFPSTASLFTSRLRPTLTRNPGYRPHPRWSEERAANLAPYPALARVNRTLAEELRDRGFRTLAVFTNPHHHATSGFWQGFEAARYLPPRDPEQQHAVAGDVRRHFLELLDAEPPGERRLYAHLHFMDPHTPYRPPARLAARFAPREGRDRFVRHGIPETPPSAEDLAYMRGLYDAEIRHVDDTLARIARDLEERGLWHDTLVVFAADHGEEFLEHGGLGHGTTLERELLRAPLVLGNATGRPPHRETRLVANLDLAPSILHLLGLPPAPHFGGRPLPGVGPAGAPARSESPAAWKSLRSLTTPAWHLVHDEESGELRLYDLRADPDGRVDLAAERPDEVARLRERLARWWAEPDPPSDEASPPLPPEVREQLEALGYLEEAPAGDRSH